MLSHSVSLLLVFYQHFIQFVTIYRTKPKFWYISKHNRNWKTKRSISKINIRCIFHKLISIQVEQSERHNFRLNFFLFLVIERIFFFWDSVHANSWNMKQMPCYNIYCTMIFIFNFLCTWVKPMDLDIKYRLQDQWHKHDFNQIRLHARRVTWIEENGEKKIHSNS